MNYQSFSLNGTWKMSYAQGVHTDKNEPAMADAYEIENAVPGYWEDMVASFQMAPFFRELKVNPDYGIQRYPIGGYAPDMALPNIMGTFFYHRTFLWEAEEKVAEAEKKAAEKAEKKEHKAEEKATKKQKSTEEEDNG